jgi:hypothetical protein
LSIGTGEEVALFRVAEGHESAILLSRMRP